MSSLHRLRRTDFRAVTAAATSVITALAMLALAESRDRALEDRLRDARKQTSLADRQPVLPFRQ